MHDFDFSFGIKIIQTALGNITLTAITYFYFFSKRSFVLKNATSVFVTTCETDNSFCLHSSSPAHDQTGRPRIFDEEKGKKHNSASHRPFSLDD